MDDIGSDSGVLIGRNEVMLLILISLGHSKTVSCFKSITRH
jgi:hypothetical protein